MALSSDKVALVVLTSCVVLWQCGFREWSLAWGPGRSRCIFEISCLRCSASPGPYPLLVSLRSELYSLKLPQTPSFLKTSSNTRDREFHVANLTCTAENSVKNRAVVIIRGMYLQLFFAPSLVLLSFKGIVHPNCLL